MFFLAVLYKKNKFAVKKQPRMKQFLFISLFIGLAINAYSHHTPTTEQKELEGEVIYSKTSVPKMKRTPIIADILMII